EFLDSAFLEGPYFARIFSASCVVKGCSHVGLGPKRLNSPAATETVSHTEYIGDVDTPVTCTPEDPKVFEVPPEHLVVPDVQMCGSEPIGTGLAAQKGFHDAGLLTALRHISKLTGHDGTG